MKRSMALLITVFVATASLQAQNTPLFFSVNGVETASNGVGGTAANPGNQAAIFHDEAVIMATPGATSNVAHACFDRANWAAFFGDDDGDGSYAEGVIGHTDCLHLRANAANPPSIFDFWVSMSDNVVGPDGATGGVTIQNGDVFRLLPGGGIEHFITEAQLAQAMNTQGNFDVDAFTRDDSNGDLYFSLTTTETVNGSAVDDGGVIRLPASGYVASSDGRVLSVTTGAATIVLHEIHVNIYFATAGEGAVGDLRDFTIAPGGGTFTGFGGAQIPHLWMCGDTANSGAVVVSTENGGSIAVLNGTPLLGGPAFGLWPTDPTGFPNSNLTCLCLGTAPLTTMPRHLSVADHSITTPSTLTMDASGCSPGWSLYLYVNLAVGGTVGGFSPRSLVPAGSIFDVPGSFPELFVDDYNDPLFLEFLYAPPLLIDLDGYGSRSYPVPALPPGTAVSIQGLDVTSLAVTDAIVVVME